MTKISDLIALLRAIELEHGDIPVRYLAGISPYGDPEYEEVEVCEFTTDKAEPQTSDNPYTDGFALIE